MYCGTIVTDEGKERRITIDFEPFKPINTSLYLCDNKVGVCAPFPPPPRLPTTYIYTVYVRLCLSTYMLVGSTTHTIIMHARSLYNLD